MSTLVHKSGSYSNIEVNELGELALPQGRHGETAAYGRPPGTEERISSYLLTEYLEKLGVEVIFGLCGHTVIGLLDALGKSKICYVSTRHEQVAAHAADGYARVTGKPGVLMTHLGPGLANAVTGVANAALDSIPMVVIAGDIPSYYYGRHPHQEINQFTDAGQFEIYRPFCKRIYRVDRVDDLPRIMERALHLSMSGRPGPVLVDVPMDHFSSNLFVDAFSKVPPPVAKPSLDAGTAQRIVEALAQAERPVLYAGGGVMSPLVEGAPALLAQLAEALEIPVSHTLMGKGCLTDNHPLLAGQTGFWGVPVSNDVPRRRVSHDVADVALRVKSAVASVRVVGRRGVRSEAKTDAVTPRANLGELGIFFNLAAPALIVNQVPVKGVELVKRHQIQNLFDFRLGEKMAAHVQHEAPPGEARLVLDLGAWNLPVHTGHAIGGENFRRQQLQQRLRAVKQTRLRRRVNDHERRRDREFISFRSEIRLGIFRGQKNHGAMKYFFGSARNRGFERITGGLAQPLGQKFRGVSRGRIRRNARFGRQFEHAAVCLEFHRRWDDAGDICRVEQRAVGRDQRGAKDFFHGIFHQCLPSKCSSISSRVLPLVSGRKNVAVMK